ncbi:MAG: PAS domain-containing sensor histidine kinase, partial [Bradyrhizobium sp.]|uniref:PAS domain-containing protein n=1 Tax=Bradyrhizobium sp. TaxID=376 RepID=UPI001A1942DD|nr:PAS domain-containing sensor histidine kinase [Bradyrhizobium sp.]
RALLGFRDLFEAGLERARGDALREGRAATPIGIGQMVLQRVGTGADVGLVALIEPAAGAASARPAAGESTDIAAPPAMPEDAQPAPPEETPSGVALFDAFTDPPETPAETAAPTQPAGAAAADAAGKTPVENQPQAIASPQAEAINAGMVEPPSGQQSLGQESMDQESLDQASLDQASSGNEPTGRQAPPAPRQHPLRFLWQVDAEGRFVLLSDDFIGLIGARTAAGFGRPWREIAADFSLDGDGRVAKALDSQDTWAGITVNWPADGGEHIPVELAGLPVYDNARNFAGFKGFGVCRDLDALNRLEALRRFEQLTEPPAPQGLSAEAVEPWRDSELESEPEQEPQSEPEPEATAAAPIEPPIPEPIAEPDLPEPDLQEPDLPEPTTDATSHPTELDTPVETPPNVVPFRPHGDTRAPTLTPVENSAFNELARQLSERLERERETIAADASSEPPAEIAAEPAAPEVEAPQVAAEWLTEPAPPARGMSTRDRTLLDLLPTGILIYRLDRLLYANPAFLARMGHASVSALEHAGGLDALYV